MNQMNASTRLATARTATRRWNKDNPDQFCAFEWVEEALIASIKAHWSATADLDERMAQWQRAQEFTRKLPEALCAEIGL